MLFLLHFHTEYQFTVQLQSISLSALKWFNQAFRPNYHLRTFLFCLWLRLSLYLKDYFISLYSSVEPIGFDLYCNFLQCKMIPQLVSCYRPEDSHQFPKCQLHLLPPHHNTHLHHCNNHHIPHLINSYHLSVIKLGNLPKP